LLCDVVHRAGKLPLIHTFDKTDIFTALSHDKKKIGNSLQWVLLKDIGKPVIVPHSEVGDRLVRKTIEEFISAN
jgi:3-dehydroquinate synthetase